MVNLEEYRTLFMGGMLLLVLVAASPVLGVIMPMAGSERFSGLWLLGPDHVADGYPSNVRVGEAYSVFVGVDNHMGDSEYYMVYVKFSDSSEFLPDVTGDTPSSLPELYKFRFFVDDGGAWHSAVTFGFDDVAVEGNVLTVGNVTINGVAFPVAASAYWDSERQGYFFELFFELWRYDVEDNSFRFDERYVGLSLNMTA